MIYKGRQIIRSIGKQTRLCEEQEVGRESRGLINRFERIGKEKKKNKIKTKDIFTVHVFI